MKDTVTVRVAVDRFLSSARCRNPNTRRAYTGVLDRLAEHLDPGRELAATTGQDIADAMAVLWGQAKPATWNRNRAVVSSFLVWAAHNGYPAPGLPDAVERQPAKPDATRTARHHPGPDVIAGVRTPCLSAA